MPKKKKFIKSKRDDWDIEVDRKHRKMIRERERRLRRKYKQGWDVEGHQWKEGFLNEEWDA